MRVEDRGEMEGAKIHNEKGLKVQKRITDLGTALQLFNRVVGSEEVRFLHDAEELFLVHLARVSAVGGEAAI